LTQTGTQPFKNSGWIGGGQIGFLYQYQWAVFGLEADFQAFNPKGSTSNNGAYPITAQFAKPCNSLTGGTAVSGTTFGGCEYGFQESSSGKWLTTVRGKVGAVWNNWMFYGTAGIAWAKMTFTSNFTDNTCQAALNGPFPIIGCNLASQFSVTQTKVGPTGGVGLSYMLTRNWIVSVEYLYVSLDGYAGDTRAVNTTNGCGLGTGAPGANCNASGRAVPAGVFGANFHYDTHFQENILRAKLDYKF
jgi:outer membrane immunogenic protein